ncbi:MAG TPA: hypothetical protein PK916_04755 [Bacteroidota bacterium]|nr:hypothetical protein [Bacteroidota bacterium]
MTREQRIAFLTRLGMSRAHAEMRVAIALGEIQGDVILKKQSHRSKQK